MNPNTPSTLPQLRLKKGEHMRIVQGHLWVYSNEVDSKITPLKAINGNLVNVVDYKGQYLGTASFNANALICARIISKQPLTELNTLFFTQKIQQALGLRNDFFKAPYYRLIFGEGDFLPGLVIDRFDNTFVIQTSTQAIDEAKPYLQKTLYHVFGQHIRLIYKNDGKGRQIENLPLYTENTGDNGDILLTENNTLFSAPLVGQKTGWFYDHRLGRAWLNAISRNKSVLDLFSYVGGWGIQAANHGASQVQCVDISSLAGEYVLKNALLNGLNQNTSQPQVTFTQANVFDWLKIQSKSPQAIQHDVVVLDPPALIQKRKDYDFGRQAYFSLNEMAMQLVKCNGYFVTASCSLHLSVEDLYTIVQQTAKRLGKTLQFLHQARPAADHPQALGLKDTEYVKCLMFKVLN